MIREFKDVIPYCKRLREDIAFDGDEEENLKGPAIVGINKYYYLLRLSFANFIAGDM